jgi:hypothetical protein
VQVHHDEGVANRIDPESCADAREGIGEANRRMALAIWAICLLEWVRGLVFRGFKVSTSW